MTARVSIVARKKLMQGKQQRLFQDLTIHQGNHLTEVHCCYCEQTELFEDDVELANLWGFAHDCP